MILLAYRKELYELAKQTIDGRRLAAENEAEIRTTIVSAKIPEIALLQSKMKQSAYGVLKVIGMGADAAAYIENLRQENLSAQERIKSLLAENGFEEKFLEPDYTCKNCNDTGFVDGRLCSCHIELLKKYAAEQICRNSNLKLASFDEFSLDYYKDSADNYAIMNRNFEFCKGYAENFDLDSYSLMLTGSTGLGKTHLSLAIAKTVLEKGYNVVYGTAQKLFTAIEREHFGRADEPDGTTEDMLTECDLLILDDLGAEFSTSFTVAAVNNILNSRILDNKPTIVSTNLSLAELQKRYTERLASRIIGEYQILSFVGKDIRQQKNGI